MDDIRKLGKDATRLFGVEPYDPVELGLEGGLFVVVEYSMVSFLLSFFRCWTEGFEWVEGALSFLLLDGGGGGVQGISG